MNYHVFYDSFTGDIEHSGIFDLFFRISIKENKSGEFGRVDSRFQNRCVKSSGDPQPVLPSLLRPNCPERVNSWLSPTPTVPTKKKGKEEHNEKNFSSCNYCSASE